MYCTDGEKMKKIELSIVIIGYNESKNIKRTINAIKTLNLKEITYEIIYVDSNSNDDSIYILNEYKDVKTYSIEANRYTAALGRFVGSQHSNGKYILFLDADMEIEKSSDIKYCIEILNKKEIGVVSGKLPEKWYIKDKLIKEMNDRYNVNSEIQELDSPGGYFIIKKEVLNQCGNFDIELSCNEEIDLFARIKNQNLKLIRTNKLSCMHYYYMSQDSKNGFTRFKEKYYSYLWKVINKSIKNNYIKEYLSFYTQVKTLRSMSITLIMLIIALISIKNIYILSIPLLYYILLIIKNKFNITIVVTNQFYNIIQLISIIFLFTDDSIKYEAKKIKNNA